MRRSIQANNSSSSPSQYIAPPEIRIRADCSKSFQRWSNFSKDFVLKEPFIKNYDKRPRRGSECVLILPLSSKCERKCRMLLFIFAAMMSVIRRKFSQHFGGNQPLRPPSNLVNILFLGWTGVLRDSQFRNIDLNFVLSVPFRVPK